MATRYQSSAAGRDLPLPVVGNFTMLGVPNQGGTGPWNGWHDNFFANAAYAYVLSKVLSHAWHKLLAGSTISVGTDVLLTSSTFEGFDETEKKIQFVRRYSPGLGNLLPDFSGFADRLRSGPVSRLEKPAAQRFESAAHLCRSRRPNGGHLWCQRKHSSPGQAASWLILRHPSVYPAVHGLSGKYPSDRRNLLARHQSSLPTATAP